MKIFLIRHGESTQNTSTNYDNFPDHKIPLTENGILQAKECGIFLKDYLGSNFDTSKSIIYVSPFTRTIQTTEELNAYLGITNIKKDFLLVERQYGIFDNLTFEERAKHKDAFEFSNWMYQNDGHFYTKFPLGESPFDVLIRARLFFESTIKNLHNVENVFIVSHGVFLKTLQMSIFGYDLDWYNSNGYMKNCAIKCFEINGDKKVDYNYIFKSDK